MLSACPIVNEINLTERLFQERLFSLNLKEKPALRLLISKDHNRVGEVGKGLGRKNNPHFPIYT